MLSVGGLKRTAILKIFSCFSLYAEEDLRAREPRSDSEIKGHVKYMNQVLADTIMTLNELGIDPWKEAKPALEPVNNYIEQYAYGRVPKMMEFKQVVSKIGALIASSLRRNFNLSVEDFARLPKTVSINMGGQMLGLMQQVAPDELQHERKTKSKPEEIGKQDVYKLQQEKRDREAFLAEERKKQREEERKRKLSIFKQLKLALAPGYQYGVQPAPVPDQSTTQPPKAMDASKDPSKTLDTQNKDLETTKQNADMATKAMEELQKKMESLNQMFGG